MQEVNPSDRVQVRGRGELMHPGACALCGSGNCDDGYIDVGVYYEYEGQVYFCKTCMDEIIGVAGGLPSEEAEFLKAVAEEASLKLKAVEADNERLRTRLDHFDALFPDVTSHKSPDVTSTESESEEPVTVLATGVSDSGESAPSESSDKQRLTLTPRSKRGNATGTTIEL